MDELRKLQRGMLRLDADLPQQDIDTLEALLQAGCQAVANECNRSLDELREIGLGEPSHPLSVAAVMVSANLYRHPEPTEDRQFVEVPYTVSMLIKPYVKL